MKLEDPAVASVLGGTRSGPGSSVGLPKSILSIPRVASLGAGSVFLGEAVILGGDPDVGTGSWRCSSLPQTRSLAGWRRARAAPDSLLCLALCNRCRNLCWGRRWKVAGMEGGEVGGKQLIAMVTSGFAKFFPSVWFRSQPLHLAEGTSLGVSARGRRWEAAGGRWETGTPSPGDGA